MELPKLFSEISINDIDPLETYFQIRKESFIEALYHSNSTQINATCIIYKVESQILIQLNIIPSRNVIIDLLSNY